MDKININSAWKKSVLEGALYVVVWATSCKQRRPVVAPGNDGGRGQPSNADLEGSTAPRLPHLEAK